MKIFIKIVLFILVVFILFNWINYRDNELNEKAEKYEQCVKNEYGVSPSFWYQENGEYPECNY